MEHFSYKGGCGVCERMRIEVFKRKAGGAIDELVSNKMIFKIVIPLRN